MGLNAMAAAFVMESPPKLCSSDWPRARVCSASGGDHAAGTIGKLGTVGDRPSSFVNGLFDQLSTTSYV